MLGWEFPPKISGGLGVASKSLAEALAVSGHQVSFLLPKKDTTQVSKDIQLIDASTLKPDVNFWKKKKVYTETLSETSIGSMLMPYLDPEIFVTNKTKTQKKVSLENTEDSKLLEKIELTGTYEADLGAELLKYAMLAVQVAKKERPDIIHAHDWITFRAAVLIKKTLDLPIVLHTHSTEYDRNGQYAQQHVIDEERSGFEQADQVIAVSQKLKYTIITSYGIDGSKIKVVPNILTIKASIPKTNTPKHIAFIGRLTHQKSPSIFIDLARDLCSKGYDFHFSVIGDGYLRGDLEHRVATSNFSERIKFEGFLDRAELLKKFSSIDLLVVPSASEPFGLVALEAILKGIPVAAALGIGVGEFIPSIPQVERWDHYSYIKLIERLMTDEPYRKDIVTTCQKEAARITPERSVNIMEQIYQDALDG